MWCCKHVTNAELLITPHHTSELSKKEIHIIRFADFQCFKYRQICFHSHPPLTGFYFTQMGYRQVCCFCKLFRCIPLLFPQIFYVAGYDLKIIVHYLSPFFCCCCLQNKRQPCLCIRFKAALFLRLCFTSVCSARLCLFLSSACCHTTGCTVVARLIPASPCLITRG